MLLMLLITFLDGFVGRVGGAKRSAVDVMGHHDLVVILRVAAVVPVEVRPAGAVWCDKPEIAAVANASAGRRRALVAERRGRRLRRLRITFATGGRSSAWQERLGGRRRRHDEIRVPKEQRFAGDDREAVAARDGREARAALLQRIGAG